MSKSKECRDHAAMCRELALGVTDPEDRKIYEDLAETWQKLAEKLGEMDQLIESEKDKSSK
jgi:hypothetical protein